MKMYSKAPDISRWAKGFSSSHQMPWILVSAGLFLTLLLLMDTIWNGWVITQHLAVIVFFSTVVAIIIQTDKAISQLMHGEGFLFSVLYGWVGRWKTSVLHSRSQITDEVPESCEATSNNEVYEISSVTFNHYIYPWSSHFVGQDNQDVIGEQMKVVLDRCLCILFNKLKTVDVTTLLLQFAEVTRDHLARLHCAVTPASNRIDKDAFRFRHPAKLLAYRGLTVDKHYSFLVQKVLESLHVPQEFNNSLIDNILSKIITHQIFIRGLEQAADPEYLHAILSDFLDSPPSSQPATSTQDVHEELKTANDHPDARLGGQRNNEQNSPVSKDDLSEPGGQQRGGLDLTGYKATPSKSDGRPPVLNAASGKIASALGGLFSATAGPLLPDNIAFTPFNKMWRSASEENVAKEEAETYRSSSRKSSPSKGIRRPSLKSLYHALPSVLKGLSQDSSYWSKRRHSHQEDMIGGKWELLPRTSASMTSSPTKSNKMNGTFALNLTNDDASGMIRSASGSVLFSQRRLEEDLQPQADRKEDKLVWSSVEDDIIYEDNQDLESTIQKLKHLLSQKSSSSEEKDVNDQGIPSDGRLFVNISIKDAETLSGNELAFVISYDGVYLERLAGSIVRSEGKRQNEANSNNFKYVLKNKRVKKKFQDFLQLKSKLKNGKNLTPELPDVNCSKDDIKVSLERWLIEVSKYAASEEALKDFLEYSRDNLSLAAQKKVPLVETHRFASQNPRIDKFAKKMSGMFHTLKEALPTFEEGSPPNSNDSIQSESGAQETPHSHASTLYKSFLFPGFFPQASIASPTASPGIDNTRTFTDSPASPNVSFLFHPSASKCDFEAILEFHINHKDNLLKYRHAENVPKPKPKAAVLLPGRESNEATGNLSSILIELLLADLTRSIPSTEWIAKDLTVQIVKSLLKDALQEVLDCYMKQVTTDEGWNLLLGHLRRTMWPEQVSEGKGCWQHLQDDDLIAKLTHLKEVLVRLGFNLNEVKQFAQMATSERDLNEDLMLNLLDLVFIHLLKNEA